MCLSTKALNLNLYFVSLSSSGRPPWYDSEGQGKEAFVIGLAGGSASGKTTVARKIIESLNVDWVGLLSMDSFYKVLTPEQHEAAAKNEYDFDHPGKRSASEWAVIFNFGDKILLILGSHFSLLSIM